MNKPAESKPYQLIMPLAIYNAPDISSTAKLILTEIFNLIKAGNKTCYASNGHFAEMFNIGEKQKGRALVSYYIKQLEEKKWIISKSVKSCNIDKCSLKNRGWHRHIIAGDTLSNIFDSLSNKTVYPIKPSLIPYQNGRHDKNNIENNIENKENFEKIEKIKQQIRSRVKSFR